MLSNVRGQLTKLWPQSTVQLPPEVKVQLEVTYTGHETAQMIHQQLVMT